ncbi:ornithine decarboxylase-like isoform X2 [Rhopilema esculentum]|uniref:ornithine decarboxylase-like isoform X2 n=1 Tax=Rhopilema esculentum TaxID=499914 RepID=UPI0031D90BB2
MKFIVGKDTVVETIADDMKPRDIINAKVNSFGREDKDDAFIIGDLGDIINKIKKFKQHLPNVEPFYAVKCNNEPTVLNFLSNNGLGFDCASKVEIQTMLNLGVSPDRIIFANPCKQTSHIKYAASNNVSMMTFDNEQELHKIKANYPHAQLVIRIKVDDSKSLFQLGVKFGVLQGKTRPLLEAAKRLQLNVIGVSFHVGSGCYDSEAFYYAVKAARNVFNEGESLGFNFTLLDIGGGFPGNNAAAISFEESAEQLNRAFAKYFPANCGVRIIAEPGRFYVSSAYTIVCNITSVRSITGENSSEKSNQKEGFMYYVNDGVYGSFNCINFDHNSPVPEPLEPSEGRKLFPSIIWGPTCDSVDCIKKGTMLPEI